MQVKTQRGITLLLKWLKLERMALSSVDDDMEQLSQFSHIAGGSAKWYSLFEKQFISFL